MITLKDLKRHCRVDTDDDNDLLRGYLNAAMSYAEQYQGKNYTVRKGSAALDKMRQTTRQAILMMVSYWYDNRDLSWTNTAQVSQTNSQDRTMQAVNNLLYFDRVIRV